jgi:PTH1 family peptidyl-tRNA hydrolase
MIGSVFRKLFGFRPVRPRVDCIIVGLGNPGQRYRDTRHNIGFDVVDRLAGQHGAASVRNECHATTAVVSLADECLALVAKPDTFMNRSGEAVAALCSAYKLPLESCLVVVDDFNLPLGAVRFRRKGSAGGHNGLKSIIDTLGADFPRLRLGVGPLRGESVIDFVLGPFEPDESAKRESAVAAAVEGVRFYACQGVDAAMNKFNG